MGARRWLATLAAAALGLTAYLGVVASADAISRDRAEKIALRALKPAKKGAGRRVTVAIFGLRAPLGPRAVVTEGGPPRRAKGGSRIRHVRTTRRLGRRTWLFWRDSRYGAMFAHPSVLLLVDDRTGRVRSRKRLSWWPLINRRQPPFLRNTRNYLSKRFRIYSDLDLVKRRKPVRRGSAAFARSAAAPSPDRAKASDVPPAVFAEDCLLTLHYRGDPRFLVDVRHMEATAKAAGIRTFRVENRHKAQPPTESDLRQATSKVVAEGCKDVLLYINAHATEDGSILTGEKVVGVSTRGRRVDVVKQSVLIRGAALTRAIGDQILEATFKVKVDTCYAGQQLGLMNLPNVLIVETASDADEPAYSHLSMVPLRRGDGTLYVLRNTRNKHKMAEFTNRNVVGMQRFFERPDEIQHGLQQSQLQNTSFLAWSMSRAFALGENADFASLVGWTDPQLQTKFQPSPPD